MEGRKEKGKNGGKEGRNLKGMLGESYMGMLAIYRGDKERK